MKKIFSALIAVVMLSVLSVSVFAADVERLVDNAGIVEGQYFDVLLGYLDEKSAELDFDFAVVTEVTLDGVDVVSYADDYYDYNGFDSDGILLLIAMDTREWAFSTSGFGITVFGDSELYDLEEAMLGELSDGNYAQAIFNYAQTAVYYVNYAKTYGYGFSEDGYYTHDSYDGYEDAAPMPWTGRLAICAIIGAIVSLIAVLVMRGKMNTVHRKAAAADYIRQGSLNVYRSNDYFLNKTVSRTPRNTESRSGGSSHHGGGSSHISSSGHSHGGSHGHF